MQHGGNIASLCKTRLLQHHEEARIAAKEKLDAIESSAKPLSDSDENAQRPLMIPLYHKAYDVWKLIIDNITDPTEVLKLWDLSPVFREILSDKRKYVQARLPEVVNILVRKHPYFLQEDQDDGVDAEDDIDPLIVSITKTILKLRMISRSCKTSMDNVLKKDNRVYKPCINIPDVGGAEELIEKLLGEDMTPDFLYFHCVQVDDHWLDEFDVEPFYDAIGIFLELVGQRVNTFKFKSQGTPQEVYEKLRNVIMYLPNLKALELIVMENHGHGVAAPNVDDLQPFPICPHLKSFKQKKNFLPGPYLQRVFEACPIIEDMVVDDYQGRALQGLIDPPQMNVALPHLERLDTPMHASLLRYLDFQIPLKQLILHDHETSQKFSTLGVFTFLNQFKETLEQVELWIDVNHSEKAFLNLPRLKVFKWEYDISFEDMRFLLHAGRLEVIETEVYNATTNARSFSDRFVKKVIKGFDGFCMWRVFPALKKFEMRFPLLEADEDDEDDEEENTSTIIYVRG